MPTRRFWIVAGLLLVWALIGDVVYLSQVTADLTMLAKTDPIAARAFAGVPTWVWSAYAIAVWVATAAAIALLLRRKLAVPLYALSLAAVLVQFSWTFFVDTVIAEKGPAAAFLPVTIIVLAVFSLWYARRKASQGVLG